MRYLGLSAQATVALLISSEGGKRVWNVTWIICIFHRFLWPPAFLLCRAQRRSPAGWRTWWRCTLREWETWNFWRAWTCIEERAVATLKSSPSRPTCTLMRVRSDDSQGLELSPWVMVPFRLWWTHVVLAEDAVVSFTLTCTSLGSCWGLKAAVLELCSHPCCGPVTEHVVSFHSFHLCWEATLSPLSYKLC